MRLDFVVEDHIQRFFVAVELSMLNPNPSQKKHNNIEQLVVSIRVLLLYLYDFLGYSYLYRHTVVIGVKDAALLSLFD